VPNIVPGAVKRWLGAARLSAKKIAAMSDQIRARRARSACRPARRSTCVRRRITTRRWPRRQVQKSIEAACAKLGFKHQRQPAGGHDAQMMSLLGPMGMIFVQRRGISHSPKELTGWLGLRARSASPDDTVLDWAGR